VVGARILSTANLDAISEWVLAHHERPDGRGYPRGLRGDEIPLESQIIAIADAYAAMTAVRSYKPGIGIERARQELEANAGTQFDAEAVSAFLALGKHPSGARSRIPQG
jgi:HD-GYP domain-containing protein (c-di-GMP phosphodiesterase class II)